MNSDICQRQYYKSPPNVILPAISQKFLLKRIINMKMSIQITLDIFPRPESEDQIIKVDAYKYICYILLKVIK